MKTEIQESKVKILILITGSIAAVRIPLLVSQLVKENFEIKCVLSENARKLIQPLSLSILSRNHCILENDQWSNYHSKPLHIDLCNWADILVMAPLTATTLSKWVNGNADGLIPSILIANTKPIIVAPAMNTKMWLNQAVQKNYNLVQDYKNVLCLQPSEGTLACDETGIGQELVDARGACDVPGPQPMSDTRKGDLCQPAGRCLVLRIEVPDIAHRRVRIAHVKCVRARNDTLGRSGFRRDDQVIFRQVQLLQRPRHEWQVLLVLRARERASFCRAQASLQSRGGHQRAGSLAKGRLLDLFQRSLC